MPEIWSGEVTRSALDLWTCTVAYVIPPTPKRTTTTAAMIRPHGRRGWVTTCVGGRVRPLPVGRADVFVPEREAELPPHALRLSSGLRSLAKAPPRYGARACAVQGGHALLRAAV